MKEAKIKISEEQAKAIACTLFGGSCEYLGNISDEPSENIYAFARGIFSIVISDESNSAVICVQESKVGAINLHSPLDLNFHRE